MIWLWIAAAVGIGWWLCRGRAAWYHWIWLLLPVEYYGLPLAGATIKPYLLFGVLLFAATVLRERKLVLHIGFCALTLLLLLSDCLTRQEGTLLNAASVRQHALFLWMLGIAFRYLRIQKKRPELDQIAEVTISAAIAYGAVFAAAYACYDFRIPLPAVAAPKREVVGIVLEQWNRQTMTPRLRGFSIDPNAVISAMLPGASFGLWRLIEETGQQWRNAAAALLTLSTAVLTGSRMAILCCLFLACAVLFALRRRLDKRRVIGVVLVLLTAILLSEWLGSGLIEKSAAFVRARFTERAGLSDEAGRLSIWRENLSCLIQSGRLLTGVGQNQIYLLTASGKHCHNTWLEWICGTGLLLGTGMDLRFLLAWRRPMRRCAQREWIPLVLAYLTVLVCISTVDNITNPTLILLMVQFRYAKGATICIS